MKKDDLVQMISSESGISKSQAATALKSFTTAITGSLAEGNKVTLSGLGTFTVTEKAAREGRNPRTGETIHINARNGVKFKAGNALRDAVK